MKKESLMAGRQQDHESTPDRYAPIPPNGKRCEFSGLGHGRLYQLLDGPAKPFVRVASLREPGKTRGTRLFHVGDLLRFLDTLAAEQAAAEPGWEQSRNSYHNPLTNPDGRDEHDE